MNTKYLAIGLSLCFAFGLARAEDKKPLTDKKDKISYSMGFNTGNSWKRNGIETNDVDTEVFLQGLRDSLANKEAAVGDKENRDVMTAFQSEIRARQMEKRKALADKNKKEGEAFLAENKTKPGVQTLPDGLQYKILKEGNGPKPTTNDMVSVNYRGTLIDGTEFDASKTNAPARFRVTGVIKGWTEALQMMPTGSKWQLFIPSELAYGDRGFGPKIGPSATLIFELELLSIEPQTPPPPAPAFQAQPVTSDIIKVPSAEELKKGAKIEIIKPDQIEQEKQKEQNQKK